MSELLQEFVDSGSQRLRVDRDAGVIRGVKLLGLNSRNGRRYREGALVEAIGLYEGAKSTSIIRRVIRSRRVTTRID